MRIVPFQAEHIVSLRGRLQRMQQAHDAQCTFAFGQQLAEAGAAWTGLQEGRVIVCAGILPWWTGRGHLWAYLADDAGPHMTAITREVRRRLDEAGMARYEAEVATEFLAAHRWVRMLGFKCETPRGMEGFFPDGSKGFLYARVQ